MHPLDLRLTSLTHALKINSGFFGVMHMLASLV
jgi:hypothetical protein